MISVAIQPPPQPRLWIVNLAEKLASKFAAHRLSRWNWEPRLCRCLRGCTDDCHSGQGQHPDLHVA
jgi:hypothetical protein